MEKIYTRQAEHVVAVNGKVSGKIDLDVGST